MKKIKRLLITMLSMAMGAVSFVEAAYILELPETAPVAQNGILVGYDAEGKLCYVEALPVQAENGFQFLVPEAEDVQKVELWKFHIPGETSVIGNLLKKEQETVEPSDPTGDVNKEPETESEKNQDTQQPSGVERYPTAADAATAFAVVNKATKTILNDETVVELEILLHGEKRILRAEESEVLYAAPDAHPELEGVTIGALQCGDVIGFTTNMSGKLISMELLFRPQKKDYVTDGIDHGASFEQLYTKGGTVGKLRPVSYLAYGREAQKGYQYAFGMIKESKSEKYMILCNEQGRASEDLEILLSEQTIVYTYNPEDREKLSVGIQGDLFASEIPSGTRDEDDNVLSWDDESVRNYVLVRMHDGVALEAVVYQNYNL